MFVLKGKRVKLSTLMRWAAEGSRSIHIDYNKSYGDDRHLNVFLHDRDGKCELFDKHKVIDDISPKILGHKWMDGKASK